MPQLRNLSSREKLTGELKVAPDKSIAQRSIILSSVAEGETIVENFPSFGDPRSTLDCLKALNLKIREYHEKDKLSCTLKLNSEGFSSVKEPSQVLDFKNSGTGIRLMSGLLSGLGEKPQKFFVLSGDNSLVKRPMSRIIEPLLSFGAEITSRENNSFAPICLKSKELKINKDLIELKISSAQVKSCLLLACLNARGTLSIEEPKLSRNHTENFLQAMGADLKIFNAGKKIILKPSELKALPIIRIPGDLSSAAFFIAAACIVPNSSLVIRDICLNSTRIGLLKVLREMNAKIQVKRSEESNRELIGDIKVDFSDLRGIEISGEIIPSLIDEIPIISVLAAQARGVTVIRDASELKHKESDRLLAIYQFLKNLGTKVELLKDGLVIEGNGGDLFQPTKEFTFDTFYDHRILMSLAVASLRSHTGLNVTETLSTNVSFKNFFSLLEEKILG